MWVKPFPMSKTSTYWSSWCKTFVWCPLAPSCIFNQPLRYVESTRTPKSHMFLCVLCCSSNFLSNYDTHYVYKRIENGKIHTKRIWETCGIAYEQRTNAHGHTHSNYQPRITLCVRGFAPLSQQLPYIMLDLTVFFLPGIFRYLFIYRFLDFILLWMISNLILVSNWSWTIGHCDFCWFVVLVHSIWAFKIPRFQP